MPWTEKSFWEKSRCRRGTPVTRCFSPIGPPAWRPGRLYMYQEAALCITDRSVPVHPPHPSLTEPHITHRPSSVIAHSPGSVYHHFSPRRRSRSGGAHGERRRGGYAGEGYPKEGQSPRPVLHQAPPRRDHLRCTLCFTLNPSPPSLSSPLLDRSSLLQIYHLTRWFS